MKSNRHTQKDRENKTHRADDGTSFRPGVIWRDYQEQSPTCLADLVSAELSRSKEIVNTASSLDLIEMGAIYINDQRSLNPDRIVRHGDQIRMHTRPRRYRSPADLDQRVLAETHDTLLAEKPAGIPCDAQVDNLKENFLSFLEDSRRQPLFLVNRLSSESDGLMLIAKTLEAQSRLKRAFVENKIKRTYAIYSLHDLETRTHLAFEMISRTELRGPTQLIAEKRKVWRVEGEPLNVYYRIEVETISARPKELRESLAHAGATIIGDRALGSPVHLFNSEDGKAAMAWQTIRLEELNATDGSFFKERQD